MFTHHSKRNGAMMIVSYAGSITDRIDPPMPEFEKALNGNCSGILLDLANVEYINSVGVSSLLENYKYMQARGMNVIICNTIPQVLKVLKLARTDLLIPIAENRSDAAEMLYRMQDKTTAPKRENILLVQNHLDLHTGLRDVLTRTQQLVNYNIITSLSPLRAWKILGGKGIHLVILDVTTQMREGQHLLKQIRTNRDLKGLPFLVASTEMFLSEASYYTANGADDILRFPFNPYETPARLRTALSLYYSWQDSISAVVQKIPEERRERAVYRL